MPRVYPPDDPDEEAAGQPFEDEDEDENVDPFLAAPSAFQYLPAPAFGPQGIVRVAVHPSQVGTIVNPSSLYDRMLAERARVEAEEEEKEEDAERRAQMAERRKRREEWQAQAAGRKTQEETTAAIAAACMAELGAVRAYVRYDGGHDEGFAWLDHCVFKDGSVRNAEQMAKGLARTRAAQALKAAFARFPFRDQIDWGVAGQWASTLLGEGYGTGEYVMYGTFSVDLETGLVTDDPDPAPIVKHISLKAE